MQHDEHVWEWMRFKFAQGALPYLAGSTSHYVSY